MELLLEEEENECFKLIRAITHMRYTNVVQKII